MRLLFCAKYTALKKYKGQHLITTDGTTLLGADDKAGIAEILTALEKIIESGAPHGKISVAFTPDEEIGRGIEKLDLSKTNSSAIYGETKKDSIVFFPPVELHVIYEIENGELRSYEKTIQYDHPIRIEFFDDEIESIRFFDNFKVLLKSKKIKWLTMGQSEKRKDVLT